MRENPTTPIDDLLDHIIVGDAVSEMARIPDETVGLVFTSPPYNLKNSSGNGMKDGRGGKWSTAALLDGYADHDDSMSHDDYVEWQRACLNEMMRVLRPDGAIFYNHKWRVQRGLLQDRSDIVEGFPLRQIIIWRRKGGINFNPGYFLPTYEVIYVIAKPDFKLAPKSNSHGDVWDITQAQGNPHPAPFPIELADRVVSSTTAEIVLDPFMGSGTTAIAARINGRRYIGIELSEQYAEMARARIAGESVMRTDAESATTLF
jgi:site-specific DNA-methyltransferase (adenine-specific)